MSGNLKQLQEIVKAYESEDCIDALATFFRQNNSFETDDEYALLMKECLLYRESLEQLSVVQGCIENELTYEAIEKTDLTIKRLLADISNDINHMGDDDLNMQVFLNNVLLNRLTFSKDSKLLRIENILPGNCFLKLPTGMIIWQKQLQDRHVFQITYDKQNELKLAARTEQRKDSPTVEDTVFGKIRIHIFPGTKSGTMEIELL